MSTYCKITYFNPKRHKSRFVQMQLPLWTQPLSHVIIVLLSIFLFDHTSIAASSQPYFISFKYFSNTQFFFLVKMCLNEPEMFLHKSSVLIVGRPFGVLVRRSPSCAIVLENTYFDTVSLVVLCVTRPRRLVAVFSIKNRHVYASRHNGTMRSVL